MVFPCFQLLYMTLTVNKINGRGLISTVVHECLPKKTKVIRYYVATEGLSERWNASVIKMSGKCIATHLKLDWPLVSQL